MDFEDLLDDLSSLADAYCMARRTFARDDSRQLSLMCFAQMMTLIGDHRRDAGIGENLPKRRRIMSASHDESPAAHAETQAVELEDEAEKRPVEVEA
jgi:hypothetical protein